MNKKISIVLSLVVLASMLLSACGVATTVAPPAPTTASTQPPVAQATNTTGPVVPTVPPTKVPPTPAPTAVPPQIGGWLDQAVFTKIVDLPGAVAQLQAGAIDVYGFSSTNAEVYKTINADKTLASDMTYGAYKQLILNYATCTDKTILNPFSSMAIREAMNWAVDRTYITQEIEGGLGVPKYTILNGAFPDAARFAPELAAIATQYAYNLPKAQAVVDAEMAKMNATKDANGKWQFNGKPVTLNGIIRSEDLRKQIGDYFSTQLEKLGFTVNRQVKTSKEASPIWQGDVTLCAFSFYTAGWVSNQITRDQGADFSGFNEGTGYGIPVMAGTPSAELKAADAALYNNTFKTMDERAGFFRTALTLSMKESWWGVMVADDLGYVPKKANVTYSSDLSAGAVNHLLGYTAKFTDKTGGTMRISNANILVDPYNPIFGSNWVFDSIPKGFTEDYGFVFNPYTGLAMPKLAVKADMIAETGLPIAKSSDWITLKFQDSIAVPDDAWADWDPVKQVFITAKERAAAAATALAADPKAPDGGYKQVAKTQVTVTYTPDLFKTKWHDGSTFSVADVVMDMIMRFDPGKEKSKIYSLTYKDSVLTAFLSHFKGVRIDSTSPLTITTWDDLYALDAENSVTSWYPSEQEAYPYGTAAWHNLTPAIMAEADGKLSFDTTKATEKKVEWTGMASGPALETQDTYLKQLVTSGDIPFAPTLSKYITADEAKARYANLQAWYTAHNNLWIGTGPYYLDKVDTTAQSITVTKFKDYMFPISQWAVFSKAPIAVVKLDGPAQVAAGTEAVFTLVVSFDGKPYASKDLTTLAYTLFGADGVVAGSGNAKMTAEGQYSITLSTDVTNKLPAGAAKLSVAVVSNLVALPTFATAEFVVVK
ncbi:MAG TPA: ABC transporter substrate-binding protein [Anaerolineaceae bacterium]